MRTKDDGTNKVEFQTIPAQTIPAKGSGAFATVLLAHGSNSPMDSLFLNQIAELLAVRGLNVIRFEFAYMAGRRNGDKPRPPPRAEKLLNEYNAAVVRLDDAVKVVRPLLIGGKSLGGRIASMIAAELFAAKTINGIVCLGYPFHPQNKKDKLRTAHLQTIECPALIIQGERDPFGTRAEVKTYSLDPRLQYQWLRDGDHDFVPRLRAGCTYEENMTVAADAVATFASSLVCQVRTPK